MLTNDVQTGQRARVTLLATTIATDNDAALNAAAEQARREGKTSFRVPKQVIPAGTVYEGIVSDADDGFFDLNLDNGDAIGFYVPCPCILVERLD